MRAFIASALFLMVSAGAQPDGLSLAIPNESGLPGVFETQASRPLQTGMIVTGVSNRTREGLSLIKGGRISGPSGDETLDDALVSSFRAFLAAGLGLGFDLSLGLPYYYENLPGARDRSDLWSLGDASLMLKAALPLAIPYTAFSVFATASAPTSSRDDMLLPKQIGYHPGSDSLPDPLAHATGLAEPTLGLGAGATLNLSQDGEGPQVALHGNLAGSRTLAAASSSHPLGSIAASMALEAFLTASLRAEAEFRHERVLADLGSLGDPKGRATTFGLGLGWRTPFGLSLRAGGILAPVAWNPYRSLTVSEGGESRSFKYRLLPTLSGCLQLAWQGFPLGRDRDHDGVPDGRDRCPTVPEDRDGFQDEDGCPDPDNDGDGVPDGIDQCPYVPEDHDGFEDADGCPEPDNDHDGLPDAQDRCPNDAEDRDGFQDEDGCPDLDDDHDGIPDKADKCPHQAENFNGVEDEDGCPEIDSDGDGIPDSRDKCPNEKEIVNFYQDEDGCPDEKPEPIRDDVLPGVDFQAGGSGLLPASLKILDAFAVRLLAYPGTEIEIQGHMDDHAGPDALSLSQSRAEAVAEYLGTKGVEARRMKPVGYGSGRPIGPNRTAQGRALNRRIQIRRLN